MTIAAQPSRMANLGIFCAIGAALAFSINDVGIKLLSGGYPLPQIVFLRALVAITLTLCIVVPLEGGYRGLKTKHLGLHLIRGCFVVTANMSFFLGLAALQLAEATAIFFVSPLVITLFSVIFLSEKVGPRRWAAVAVGLLGVAVILRPGFGVFQWASILPVVAAICYASLHMMTRKLGVTEKASTMAVYIQTIFLIVMGTMGLAFGDGRFADTGNVSLDFLFRAWIWPENDDLLVMLLIGAMSGIGGYLISQAYRVSAAAVIAPFEYISLIMAIGYGIVLFAEWPDIITWIGITLIAASGLYVFWRENSKQIRNALRRPMPRHR